MIIDHVNVHVRSSPAGDVVMGIDHDLFEKELREAR